MAVPTFSEAAIRQRATAESFRRGQSYHRRGAVTSLVQRGDVLEAEVEGSQYEPYRVRITFDKGGVTGAGCDCPYDWGGWCKHIFQAQVDIFLHEGLLDDAIATVEKRGTYTAIEQVMDAVIDYRPEWVIKTACQQAERIMDAAKAKNYHHAVDWLERARAAYQATGREADWQAYLRKIRARHARKRKLMGMLRGFE